MMITNFGILLVTQYPEEHKSNYVDCSTKW